MLKFGNREFRNLQEQVLKNMQNIANLKEGTAVLSEFGIKVVGEVDSLQDLPSVIEYKTAHGDWEYGDAFAIGTEAPYTLVILTRANDEITADHWFDIGQFPAPGPQGQQGPQGEIGPQGQTGDTGPAGDDAGFGSVLATAQTLPAGSPATATVTASGPNTAKEFSFTFGIPRGSDGSNPVWGNIQGTISDQTDLKDALDAKQDELVSGTNIKTINNNSIVGSGNLVVDTGTWGNISGTLADQTDLANALAEKQPVIDASHKLSASYVSGLADVATTGAYSDLSGRPTIGEGTITIKKNNETIDSFSLNQVASQNINIVVPTKTSDITNDSDFTTKTYVDGQLALKQDVISDLSTIRSGAEAGATAIQPADLATVATTGDYDDLIDKPTIGNATLTLQVNGTNVDTFTANATTDKTINLSGIVDVASNQTITGIKTFANPVNANSDVIINVSCDDESDLEDREYFKVKDADENHTLFAVYPGWDSDDSLVQISADNFKWGDAQIATVGQLTWNLITNKPNFATVATSGSYTDLINTPTNLVTTDTAQTISGVKTWDYDGDNTIEINPGSQGVGPKIDIDTNSSNTKVYSGQIQFTNGDSDITKYSTNAIYVTPHGSSQYTINLPSSAGTLALASQIPDKIVTYTGSTQAAGTVSTGTISVGTVDLGSGNSIYTSNAESTDYYNLTLDVEDTDDSNPHYIKLHDGWYERYSGDDYDCLQSTYIRQPKYAEYNDNDHLYLELPVGSTNSSNPKVIATTDQIPTVGSGVLTIQKNGTNVDTFSANASSNKTINITVPTNNNELTNGAGYQTASDVSTAIVGKLDATACTYQTTAPTAAATDGGVHIVYLSAEPSTKYAGYIYMIAES